ncbi:TRAP transporter TAXI family solute receptor [Evansella vedderi]|uniref:TRAP transporter TAXI family solute receptor n=1 Tax=Evansella vedderi TaxID=38282 RepID=A0ABT9ZYG9_9BACI|nr:TAXI family TRAP transporter solute-binding subunit [Evansella vedderi]MDQ0256294.1 TRAP transporter TAXI family solute receptor [Evansella vedderi]
MKKIILMVISMMVMFLIACSDSSNSDASESGRYDISAATNQQQTSAYIYTAALAEILSNDNSVFEINLEVLPYSGGIGNAELVSKGEADIGIMFNMSSNWAYNGIVAYEEEFSNIRGLVGGMNEYFIGVIARTDFLESNNIESLKDIKDQQIPVNLYVNERGTLAEYNTRLTLEAYGMDYDAIEGFGGNVEFTSNDVIQTAFQDNRADLHIMALGRGHQVVAEIATMTDITLMSIEDEYHEFFTNIGYDSGPVFPAGEFRNQDYEVFVPSFYVTYIVNENMDDELAYHLAKAVYENKDAMVRSHAAMGDFIPEQAGYASRNGYIPLHDGAKKFYEEVGAID